MSSDQDIRKIITSAKDALRTAKTGYTDLLKKGPKSAEAGIRNIAVYGCSTTIKLQNLRSVIDDFDHWYAYYDREMSNDDLMRYFYKYRNEALKDSEERIDQNFQVGNLDINEFERPPNAVGTTIDKYGMAWVIEQENGKTMKYYVEVPDEMAQIRYKMENKPEKHLGKDISDKSFEEMCRLYLLYLANMLSDAENEFLP